MQFSAASIISGAIQRTVPPIWVIVVSDVHPRTSASMTDDSPKSAKQAEPSALMRMFTLWHVRLCHLNELLVRFLPPLNHRVQFGGDAGIVIRPRYHAPVGRY